MTTELSRRTPVRIALAILTGAALAVAGVWFLWPFCNQKFYGSGDAHWYVQMLADYLQQLHHGGFPVGAGATNFAFNGAVYPLRAAPYYQYLGGLVDWLTGRRLNPVGVHNTLLVASGLAGLFSAYLLALLVSGGRPLVSGGLAWLYFTCPGILALVFAQDLIMSWMTLPFIPLAWAGVVLAARKFDSRALGLSALGTSALWLCHSPIASGMTVAIAASLAVAHGWRPVTRAEVRRTVVWCLVFAACVSFPFVSLALVRQADSAGIIPYSVDRDQILQTIRSSFPGSIKPLSPSGMELGDIQLGYGLLAILLGLAFGAWRLRDRASVMAAALGALAFLLLWPVPLITGFLWRHMPDSLATLAYLWPMHRFYVPLAGVVAMAGASLFAAPALQRWRWLLALFLVGALAWSSKQAMVFRRFAGHRASTTAQTAQSFLPENRPLMVHSYGMFQRRPAYFSNGVMDPALELRILAPDERTIVAGNDPSVAPELGKPATEGALIPTRDANPGIWNFAPVFTLQPGQRTLVSLDFGAEQPHGTLLIEGARFQRVYALPESGDTRGFGGSPTNSRTLSLWTSGPTADRVALRFVPETRPAVVRPSWRFRSWVVTDGQLPVRLESLLPLTISTHLAQSGWLETFRMFTPGYQAQVNGQRAEVRRSPEGLLMVRLPAGDSRTVVTYELPFFGRVALTLAAIGWALGLAGLWTTFRTRRS